MTKSREALTSAWAGVQIRVQAQSRTLPNVFNVGNVVKRLIWTRMISDIDVAYLCRAGLAVAS
jgi:hypothetical protein